MAVNVIYTKVLELLKRAGINPQKFIGTVDPKVRKLTTKTETTATKPKLIDALTKDKKTFSDALDIFENEAKYLSQFNEMELTNFANNLQDYFTVGGKVKYTPSNVVTTEGTPVLGKQLEKISERKGAKGEADTTSLQGSMEGLMSLVDEIKGISPKMRNQMNRDELAAFIQKMRGKKFTNEEIKWVKAEMDEWGIGIAKDKATGMQYGKKLGAKSKDEFEFVNEYIENVNTYSPKEFKEMFDVKKINMDLSDIIDRKLEKHFKKKYKWDDTKRDGGLDDITYEKYEDEVYEAGKDFSDYHRVYESGAPFGKSKYKAWSNNPKNWIDEASEKLQSITGDGLNVDFYKSYTDDVLTKYPKPEKFQYGGPVIKGPDMGATAHGSGELLARSRMFQPGGQTTTSTGLNYLLGEDDATRIPFQDGLSTNKFDLSNLESLKGLKKTDYPNVKGGIIGAQMGRGMGQSPLGQRNKIKNKVISSFIYAVDNMDQETSSYVKDLFNGALQVGYETDTSGIKTDLFEKGGIVPINSETLYQTIVNLNLPKEIKAKMSAVSNMAGDKELAASLKKNNMGITWDSGSQEIIGEYIFTLGTNGNTQIQPIITKDQDSQISKEVKIDQAIGDGILNFTLNESDIDNSKGKEINYKNDSLTFYAQNVEDDDKDWSQVGTTIEIPFYLLNKKEKPFISAEVFKDMDSDFEAKKFSGEFPITDNWQLWGSRYEDDQGDWNETDYGLKYNKKGEIGEMGNWFIDAGIDRDKDWSANIGFSIPFGEPEKKGFNYSTDNPEEAFKIYKDTGGFQYEPNTNKQLPPIMFADGGIARLGFAGGKLVDASRRGFLKFLGGTAATVAALKSGLVKLMGGKNAEEVKKVIDEVVIAKETGAPDWFQPLVNKILREGKDANLTYGERQIGKVMDTPSGKVDVVYKMDTGEVELSFVGNNTALGEQVDLVYKPGQVIEEGKYAGQKEGDEFIAMETVPEGSMHGPDDYSIDIGSREADNVGDLSSDLSELKTFATGEKPTMREIVEGIKKRKERVKMEEDPGQWLTDVHGDYDPYASGGLARLLGE